MIETTGTNKKVKLFVVAHTI